LAINELENQSNYADQSGLPTNILDQKKYLVGLMTQKKPLKGSFRFIIHCENCGKQQSIIFKF